MGTSTGHFSAYQKERLGWLGYGASPPIEQVQVDGTYWIEPFESPGSNPKALKIFKGIDPATGKGLWYYLEQRRPLGFDAFLSSNSNMTNGVVLRLVSEASARNIDLLDMTPQTSSFSDPALTVGQSYRDPDTGLTITPTSVGGAGAAVSITSGGEQTCVPVAPRVSISPSWGLWTQPGSTAAYTVTLSDDDGSGCGSSRFDLQAALPEAGWVVSFTNAALTLSPGQSASTTLRVTSPESVPDGFYELAVVARSAASGLEGSAVATYVVARLLDVAVQADRSTYRTKDPISVTVTVRAAGSPVRDADALFSLNGPDGSVTSASATTAADGKGTVVFRLKKRPATGVYQIGVEATAGTLSGSATTSVTVR
jgi:hypothetical protein